ncbi:hypothetical protein AAW00_13560 [Aurantiacibacter luteus]|uniref:Portal protein n=2 Tax=Aurantiacibacter luteus TaxID=1581420 RepID=A0A0G9MP64_9SPHN|nr:hypothetical protein AAW00_13560 [Aurantiacibacter luteus]
MPAFMAGGYANKTGRSVTEHSAMANATFGRAVRLIASTVGMLPLNLMSRAADGTIAKAAGHPVHRLLRTAPNAAQTPTEFKAYMQGRALLYGDAYAYKVPGVKGVQALWPLDPLRVTAERSESDFGLVWKYQPRKGQARTFGAGELLHLRSPWSRDGLTGEGLLALGAEVLGLADAVDESAASILAKAANPGGLLQVPNGLSAEAYARLKQQWNEQFDGSANAGKWIVGEEGMEGKPFPASGREAESVAQRKLQVEEIARLTGIPRPLLMVDDTSWGSGIEQLGLFLITYCLMPWFVAWEEAVARDLLSERERETHYAKFNEAALLRGSLKDQAEFLAKALGGPGATGFMKPNEAREKMDMNPEPWGEQPGWLQGDGDATQV